MSLGSHSAATVVNQETLWRVYVVGWCEPLLVGEGWVHRACLCKHRFVLVTWAQCVDVLIFAGVFYVP